MNKSEKSFYVIIENKKCGKFSGASQIQVAKKVASKKLKSKKKTEITFHLDEVGGKKKKYGPYHGRKDKKTGKVVVVKGGKIMKGGVLNADEISKLQKAFVKNCNITLNKGTSPQSFQKRIINIPFGFISTKPLIFFNLENTGRTVNRTFGNTTFQGIVYEYKYAVFEDTNGNIWIFFKNTQIQVLHNNFFEFFLNPEIIQLSFFRLTRDQLKTVLENLINFGNQQIPPELKRIIKYANQIFTIFLLSPDSIESIIYCPHNSEPKIKKCVYPDLTFGILDEKNIYKEGSISLLPPPSVHQRFLIMRQSFFGGFSEPVIFLRIPSVDLKFDLYISKKNGKLRLTQINSRFGSEYDFQSTGSNYLLGIQNIAEYCRFLISIPSEFGNFKTVKNTADYLIQQISEQLARQPPQLNQNALQQQSFAQQPQQFTLQPLSLNANMRKRRLKQLSFAEMSKQQKIQKQTELLQELANLNQELERLKT